MLHTVRGNVKHEFQTSHHNMRMTDLLSGSVIFTNRMFDFSGELYIKKVMMLYLNIDMVIICF